MEARAVKKYIGSSPRKMRLITELIRNKSVKESLSSLKYSKKHASKDVEKTLKSAYNNLLNKLDTGKIDTEDVFIKEIYVDGGPTLKRLLPAPQGRAFRMRKRSSHLTIVVENIEIPEGTKSKKVRPVKPETKPKKVKKTAEEETEKPKVEKPKSKAKAKKDESKTTSAADKKTAKPKVKKDKTKDTEADVKEQESVDKKEKQTKGKSKKTNNKE